MAFEVLCKEAKYFVKAYEKSRGSSIATTKNTQAIGLVLNDIAEKCGLRNNIAQMITNNQGSYLVEDDEFYIIVFVFIEGILIGDSLLSKDEKTELGIIINKLHQATDIISFPEHFPREEFDIANVREIVRYLQSSSHRELLTKYKSKLQEYIACLRKTVAEYRNMKVSLVLDHTDIHKGNMMRTKGGLSLVDYETVKLAPKEQNLRLLDNEYNEVVLACYYNQDIDQSLIEFYSRLRIIDDIVEEI